MAKARKRSAKRPKLSSSQIGRLRNLLEKALLEPAFRRRLLANPRAVLAQYRIGLTAAQLRQFDQAKKAVLKKARELEQAARQAAQRIVKQARLMSLPTLR